MLIELQKIRCVSDNIQDQYVHFSAPVKEKPKLLSCFKMFDIIFSHFGWVDIMRNGVFSVGKPKASQPIG